MAFGFGACGVGLSMTMDNCCVLDLGFNFRVLDVVATLSSESQVQEPKSETSYLEVHGL